MRSGSSFYNDDQRPLTPLGRAFYTLRFGLQAINAATVHRTSHQPAFQQSIDPSWIVFHSADRREKKIYARRGSLPSFPRPGRSLAGQVPGRRTLHLRLSFDRPYTAGGAPIVIVLAIGPADLSGSRQPSNCGIIITNPPGYVPAWCNNRGHGCRVIYLHFHLGVFPCGDLFCFRDVVKRFLPGTG